MDNVDKNGPWKAYEIKGRKRIPLDCHLDPTTRIVAVFIPKVTARKKLVIYIEYGEKNDPKTK